MTQAIYSVSFQSDLGRGRSVPEELHTAGRDRGRSRGWAPCCVRWLRAPYCSLLCGASLEKTEEQEGKNQTLVSLARLVSALRGLLFFSVCSRVKKWYHVSQKHLIILYLPSVLHRNFHFPLELIWSGWSSLWKLTHCRRTAEKDKRVIELLRLCQCLSHN